MNKIKRRVNVDNIFIPITRSYGHSFLARARAYVTVVSVCLSIDTVHTGAPIDTKFGPHVHIHHSLDEFEDGFDRTSGG